MINNTLLTLPCDAGDVSDGYHTFNELYEHRYLLFIHVAISQPGAFKTRLNDKKEAWDGWFILGINTNRGQISYHLPEKYWDIADVQEVEFNMKYDGHNSGDVLERLMLLLQDRQKGESTDR